MLTIHARAATSTGNIDGYGDPHGWFCPGQPCTSAGLWHIFFYVVVGSMIAKDEIIIPGTSQLAFLVLFIHYFKLTNVVNYNLPPREITQGLLFFKNLTL